MPIIAYASFECEIFGNAQKLLEETFFHEIPMCFIYKQAATDIIEENSYTWILQGEKGRQPVF